ncbi:membrane protein [Methanobrevibacter sp. YE315]|uniref:phage holin family protein n=1 Tax=Methanobrevibacter sp. YE315 TaxID=1609968 RepID=UPI000764DB05|nr:phage holin family protein [Methanobrevibacter sp. YE315]AMD18328.1 membrane protein [Methanobrevibacter sp. YE315]
MIKNRLISSLKTIITGALIFLANVIAIYAVDFISEDFTIGPWYNAIIIVIAFAIASALLWPIFRRFFMKIIIFTFGIASLFINSIIFYITSLFVPGVYTGIYGMLQVPIVIAISTTLVTNITNTSYYDRYMKTILNYALKQKTPYKKRYPGLIMLEIDGLSINTLKMAIDKGVMPNIKRWLDEKSHTLKGWETDLSSQTGASQAGILHGNNKNIIAYRWVEKENNNKIVVSGKLSDAPELEEKISNGEGLLVNGISVANMFSGDSKIPTLTSSKLNGLSNIYNKTLNAVFLDSYNFQRLFILFLWDIILEISSQIKHYLKNIRPRMRRTIVYAAVRAGANVVLREVTTDVLTSEILTGDIDTAYATFMGYDEIAHHSGVRDEDVWGTLKRIDSQFSKIKSAIEMSDRDYEMVILSDHGQSNGATFKQRYGITLGDYVRRLLPEDLKIFKTKYNIDHFRDAVIPENKQIKSIKEKVGDIRDELFEDNEPLQNIKGGLAKRKPKLIFENEQYLNLRKKYTNSLDYIEGYESTELTTKKAEDSELIVLGSGNLGLIYLTQWKQRLNYEEIVLLFPDLIPGLVKHPGIGFILVNSISNGGMVIGQEGIYYLDNDEVVGKNPLEGFGENAAMHLKRENSFDNMPDLLVNSFYDEKLDEVCAFEELIGSHGGLGGDQTKPFILYPYDWKDPGELIGASSIYHFLKNEIEELKS